MTHTTIALILAFAPIAAGCLAFVLAAILAAFRVARFEVSPYSPEATPGETSEWIADLSLSLDVDAEWIALAATAAATVDASIGLCDCEWCDLAIASIPATSPLLQSTRETIAAFRAERAAVDAWIAARPATVDAPEARPALTLAARTYTANASRGVAAAAARIVVRVTHTAEAITRTAPALTSGRKLVSAHPFIAEAKRAIAAHTARRTLYPTLGAAFMRQWSEAMGEPYALASESPEARAAVALDSLARLAALQLDTSERAAIHAEEDRAHLASLAA